VRVALGVEERCSLQKKFLPKADPGTENVSSAASAIRRWTPSTPAMGQIGTFTAGPATERNTDRKAMDLLAVLDSCRPISYRTKRTTPKDRHMRMIARKSRLLLGKAVHDVVGPCMPLNRCLLRDRCGTKGASPVQNAEDL